MVDEWLVRGDLWTDLEEELLFWKTFGNICIIFLFLFLLLKIGYAIKDFMALKAMIQDYERYHHNFSYLRFFQGECQTYDGLYIDRIWLFTDKELEKSPYVIHYLFPEMEENTDYYPGISKDDIDKLKKDETALKAIQKSVIMMQNFWERGGSKRPKDIKMIKDFLKIMDLEELLEP